MLHVNNLAYLTGTINKGQVNEVDEFIQEIIVIIF